MRELLDSTVVEEMAALPCNLVLQQLQMTTEEERLATGQKMGLGTGSHSGATPLEQQLAAAIKASPCIANCMELCAQRHGVVGIEKLIEGLLPTQDCMEIKKCEWLVGIPNLSS
jgi:hypothetical protein